MESCKTCEIECDRTCKKDNMTIGVGAGQMNRVGSAKIAIEQAGEKAKGSVMGSDAFFPMPDTVEEAVKQALLRLFSRWFY